MIFNRSVILVFGVLVSLTVLTAGYSWLFAKRFVFFESATRDQVPWTDVILSAWGMVLGILFGCLYARIETRTRTVSIKKEILAAIRSPDFLRGLLVSPIVFCGVYAIAKAQPDRLVGLLFAFENGFFCESIFRKRRAE